jgi:hypothetical protein
MDENERPENVLLSAKCSSHGIRRAAMEDLTDNANVGFVAVSSRAGLLLQSISNVFQYVEGNTRKDKQCALALSGWPDGSKGGLCPTIDAIPSAETVQFKQFARALFRFAPDCVTEVDKISLALVLLLRHPSICAEFGELYSEHDLYKRIIEVAQNCDVTFEMLQNWCEAIHRHFIHFNGVFLSSETSNDPSQTVQSQSFAEFMNTSSLELTAIRGELYDLKRENAAFHEETRRSMAQLSADNEALRDAVERLVVQLQQPGLQQVHTSETIVTSRRVRMRDDSSIDHDVEELPQRRRQRQTTMGSFFPREAVSPSSHLVYSPAKNISCREVRMLNVQYFDCIH